MSWIGFSAGHTALSDDEVIQEILCAFIHDLMRIRLASYQRCLCNYHIRGFSSRVWLLSCPTVQQAHKKGVRSQTRENYCAHARRHKAVQLPMSFAVQLLIREHLLLVGKIRHHLLSVHMCAFLR